MKQLCDDEIVQSAVDRLRQIAHDHLTSEKYRDQLYICAACRDIGFLESRKVKRFGRMIEVGQPCPHCDKGREIGALSPGNGEGHWKSEKPQTAHEKREELRRQMNAERLGSMREPGEEEPPF